MTAAEMIALSLKHAKQIDRESNLPTLEELLIENSVDEDPTFDRDCYYSDAAEHSF